MTYSIFFFSLLVLWIVRNIVVQKRRKAKSVAVFRKIYADEKLGYPDLKIGSFYGYSHYLVVFRNADFLNAAEVSGENLKFKKAIQELQGKNSNYDAERGVEFSCRPLIEE